MTITPGYTTDQTVPADTRRLGGRARLPVLGRVAPSDRTDDTYWGGRRRRTFGAANRGFSAASCDRSSVANKVEALRTPKVGKADDPRALAFVARHGRLVQVELDALPPHTLRGLYADAIAGWWDEDAHEAVLGIEDDDRVEL